MIIDGTIFGEIRGKLSISPEEAREFFGIRLKPEAIGVRFYRRLGKLVASSIVPIDDPNTIAQQKVRDRCIAFGAIIKTAKQIIKNIWSQEAEHKDISPYNLFFKENAKLTGIPPQWKNLVLTKGPLKKPTICRACYNTNILHIRIQGMRRTPSEIATWEPKIKKFTIVSFKRGNGDFYLYSDHYFTAPLWVYAYFKKNNLYSFNTAREAKNGNIYW